MLDPPHVEPLLVSASCLTPENEAPHLTLLEDDGTSLSSLSDLTRVLPPSAQRRCVMASLRLLRYGGRARRPRGCVATRSRSFIAAVPGLGLQRSYCRSIVSFSVLL